MKYYCGQHCGELYHLSKETNFEDALEDFKKILGGGRFFVYARDEYCIDGHFQCYYLRPIYEGDFSYTDYDLKQIRKSRRETKIKSFDINDIKDIQI